MNYRRNFFILVYDATAYSIFFTLWNVNTVIPVFLDQAGSPGWTIGLASTLKQVCYLFPQLLAAAILCRIKCLSGLIQKTIWINRSQLLIFLALLPFAEKTAAAAAFFVTFMVFCLGEGFITVPWMELVGRTVSFRLRGRLFGTVQFLSGIIGLPAAYFVSTVMANPELATLARYLIIFFPGALLMFPSLYFYRFLTEPAKTCYPAAPGLLLPATQIIRDRSFKLMLLVQLLIGAGCMAAPYYIIMVRHHFIQLDSFTGMFIFLNIIGSILGGILLGYLSDNRGNRITIVVTAFFSLTSSTLFLFSQFTNNGTVLTLLLGMGFLVSGIVSGGWLGFTNYVLEFAPREQRPFYLAVNNTAMLPAALLPVAAGFIRANTGDLNLYLSTTLFAVVAFYLSSRLKEPRA